MLLGGAAISLPNALAFASRSAAGELFFEISLAQWSLHNAFWKKKLDNLDFAATARKEFDISAIEYVNQFFKDKAQDQTYLGEMNQRAEDNGVKNLLIMVDGEGQLGHLDKKERKKTVENHKKWVEAAKFLGCHSIRVNAAGKGTPEEVGKAASEGLHKLSEFAKDFDINVIVENHGGSSSIGSWLVKVIEDADMDNCGTLPDFGNFYEYDRYQGVKELMPFARGVSAKSHDFDSDGWETNIDYVKMLQIVKDAGYTGYIGIEFEGKMDEFEGVRKTKALLEMAGAKVS